jgi:hypothetical protein
MTLHHPGECRRPTAEGDFALRLSDLLRVETFQEEWRPEIFKRISSIARA